MTASAIIVTVLVVVVALRAVLMAARIGLRIATWLLLAALALSMGHQAATDKGERDGRVLHRTRETARYGGPQGDWERPR